MPGGRTRHLRFQVSNRITPPVSSQTSLASCVRALSTSTGISEIARARNRADVLRIQPVDRHADCDKPDTATTPRGGLCRLGDEGRSRPAHSNRVRVQTLFSGRDGGAHPPIGTGPGGTDEEKDGHGPERSTASRHLLGNHAHVRQSGQDVLRDPLRAISRRPAGFARRPRRHESISASCFTSSIRFARSSALRLNSSAPLCQDTGLNPEGDAPRSGNGAPARPSNAGWSPRSGSDYLSSEK